MTSLRACRSRRSGIYSEDKRSEIRVKKFFYSLVLPILSVALSAASYAEAGNVRISFDHPEKFSDFRIQGRQENVSAGIFRDEVSSYLSPIVTKRFPGSTLSLNFIDIDLPGRIDLSKTRKLSNVRIDRNIASPLRLYFDYALTDSRGKILSSGSRSLVDPDYLYRYTYYPNQTRSDTLFYEKATLSRWLGTVVPSNTTVTTK
jgi:Protein of unknown function (DUF3016)